jgi:NO-binding membrane sensor protein with MHYT domain
LARLAAPRKSLLTHTSNVRAIAHAHARSLARLHAAKHLNTDQVKLLLKYKADPKIVDVYGNSPLHFAAMSAVNWKPAEQFMNYVRTKRSGRWI